MSERRQINNNEPMKRENIWYSSNISSIRDSASSAIQTPPKSSKILLCAWYLQRPSRCLDIPVKHCLPCLIDYLNFCSFRRLCSAKKTTFQRMSDLMITPQFSSVSTKGWFAFIKENKNLQAIKIIYSRTSGCDHLSSATSFPKYKTFPSQITIFGTSCKRPPLVSDRDYF